MNSKKEYATVKIPRDLADFIDDLIDKSKMGYRTRTEFIVELIRNRVQPLNKED